MYRLLVKGKLVDGKFATFRDAYEHGLCWYSVFRIINVHVPMKVHRIIWN